MKPTKTHILTFTATIIVLAGLTVGRAATLVSYDASADPNLNPDSSQGVNVWSVNAIGGATSSFEVGPYGQGGQFSLWKIIDTEGPLSSVTATHVFSGGEILPGQTVSIDFAQDIGGDGGTRLGIRLLDASDAVQAEFSSLAGLGHFQKFDSGTGAFSVTTKALDFNDVFNVSYTLGIGGAYTANFSAGAFGIDAGAFSGTVTGSIAKIQIFTNQGNNGTVRFDNLQVLPEPSVALLLSFGLTLFSFRNRQRKC